MENNELKTEEVKKESINPKVLVEQNLQKIQSVIDTANKYKTILSSLSTTIALLEQTKMFPPVIKLIPSGANGIQEILIGNNVLTEEERSNLHLSFIEMLREKKTVIEKSLEDLLIK